MGLSETVCVLDILRRSSFCRYSLVSESRRFSRIFSLNYSSLKDENPRGERREQGKVTEKDRSSDNMDETMKKLAKEPGGKPLDEDKGMDVNWRPIAEDKPSSQSSS